MAFPVADFLRESNTLFIFFTGEVDSRHVQLVLTKPYDELAPIEGHARHSRILADRSLLRSLSILAKSAPD